MTDPGAATSVRWVVLPVAVALSLLIILLATRDPASKRAIDGRILGEVAPLIEGHDLDGQPYDIDDHRGSWVVVNFFSTTCVPCIVEHPELVAFSKTHAATGAASVVSVAFDDSASSVAEFFADNGGQWPVLTEDTGSIAVNYGVTGVPESYLIAPTGVVAAKLIGGVTAADLDARIVDLTEAANQ